MSHRWSVCILSFFMLLSPFRVSASIWTDFYTDPSTNALLISAFGLQLSQEEKAGEYLDQILKSYGKANIALSGIFLSKSLERKALHDAGILGVPGQENYYYQHIYKLVYERIIPMILRCGLLVIDHVDQAYFWVPQLYLICEDVRQLCEQFSAVVSNGRLSFNFSFPQVADEVMETIGMKDLQKVDWEAFFDEITDFDLSSFGDNAEDLEEAFKRDFDDLYQSGYDMVSGGMGAADTLWSGRRSLLALFSTKPKEFREKLDSLRDFFAEVTDKYDVKGRFEDFMGTVDSTAMLNTFFRYRDCDPARLIADFSHDKDKKGYYKERWYINKWEAGKGDEVVYEEWFDSYTMDEESFKERMEKKLESYKDKDASWLESLRVRYTLRQDQRSEYEQTEELHMEGVNQAVFMASCDDSGNLGEGAETFKVNPRHDPLNEDSKVYAMETEVSPLDQSDRDALEEGVTRWRETYYRLSGEYDDLDRQVGELEVAYALGQLDYGGENIADVIARLSRQRDRKGVERNQAADSLATWQNVYRECCEDMVDDGDIFRIPHIMNMFAGIYNLRWLEEGHWEGYTWVRRCHVPQSGQDVVLKVRLERARGESVFLGIRYHRSQITLNYGLYFSGHTDNVIEYLDLNPGKEYEEENARIVQEHLRSWREEFPDCSISVETRRQDAVKDSIEDHRVHLLWASDRVRVARDINARLELIFARLQVMERSLLLTKSLFARVGDEIRNIVTHPVEKAWCYDVLNARQDRMRDNVGTSPRRRRESYETQ